MANLVGSFQASFFPARQTGNTIVITQEAFHLMRKKTGKTGWMAIKLVLEKAYDCLKWSFIEDILRDIGFPTNMISLIPIVFRLPICRCCGMVKSLRGV